MREIEFRAWNAEERKMYYDAQDTYDYRHGEPESIPAIYFGELLESDEWEVMQYTGLRIKKATKLYEEDIVILDYVSKEHSKCVICYDSKQARYKAVPIATYKLNSGSGGWTGFELFTNCEVIGNVYENPELLGGEMK